MKIIIISLLLLGTSLVMAEEENTNNIQKAVDFFNYSKLMPKTIKKTETAKREANTTEENPSQVSQEKFEDLEKIYFDEVKTKASGTKKTKTRTK